MKTQPSKRRTPRSGFTLIELLAVITIIAVLIALILPVLQNIVGKGDEVAVRAEISQLDQALTTFRTKYGEYPPSFLKIPAVPTSGSPAWDAKSAAVVMKFWPQFNFQNNGGLNNSGDLFLSGAECLVFFLGGVESGAPGSARVSGFSSNPLTPWTASGNPIGPFMEFDAGRLVDVDGDQLFEYLDSTPGQSTPMLYLSGAGGNMNKDNDNLLRTLPPTNATHTVVNDDYDVFPSGDARNMSSCYLQPDGDADFSNNLAHKKDSFQIISPGADGEFGVGGVYSADVEFEQDRRNEADNITNLAGGTLN